MKVAKLIFLDHGDAVAAARFAMNHLVLRFGHGAPELAGSAPAHWLLHATARLGLESDDAQHLRLVFRQVPKGDFEVGAMVHDLRAANIPAAISDVSSDGDEAVDIALGGSLVKLEFVDA